MGPPGTGCLSEARVTCTYLELRGGVEFRLNGVQLHSQMLFVHLDSVTTFPLNFLFNQHLRMEMKEEK